MNITKKGAFERLFKKLFSFICQVWSKEFVIDFWLIIYLWKSGSPALKGKIYRYPLDECHQSHQILTEEKLGRGKKTNGESRVGGFVLQ
jgi:hypothetical protein